MATVRLPHTAGAVGPNEMEESAFLDGASHWIAFWRVSLPLALPAIAIAAIIAFLLGYSEFALGWLFVNRGQDVTLPLAVSGIFEDPNPQWSAMAALALMMAAPVADSHRFSPGTHQRIYPHGCDYFLLPFPLARYRFRNWPV
jgi:ABC-type spermidine/putrescine transport system permease subunit II